MKTYEEVADKEGLEPFTKEVFVRYMRTRWAPQEETQCKFGYATEWARRFQTHSEYECSDLEGRAVLKMISKDMLNDDYEGIDE